MTIFTVYTERFDSKENVFGGRGMSGKVYVEHYGLNDESGQGFSSIDDALDYCTLHELHIDRVDIHYLSEDGTQKFIKFETN